LNYFNFFEILIVKFIYFKIKENDIFLIVQRLRNSNSQNLIHEDFKLMNSAQLNRSFSKYLNRFYYLTKLDNEYDLINSNAIVKKCVLIEKNNLFFASKSLNLSHHS